MQEFSMSNNAPTPEGLQGKIENINLNLSNLKDNTELSFRDLKDVIKEWKNDFNTQFKSVNTRIDNLFQYYEASKDDRHDLHRIFENQAQDIKTLEKEVAENKTSLVIDRDNIKNSYLAKQEFKDYISKIGERREPVLKIFWNTLQAVISFLSLASLIFILAKFGIKL